MLKQRIVALKEQQLQQQRNLSEMSSFMRRSEDRRRKAINDPEDANGSGEMFREIAQWLYQQQHRRFDNGDPFEDDCGATAAEVALEEAHKGGEEK